MTIDYYIGIDAGGTSWDAVLCLPDNRIIARSTYPGMNLRQTKNPNLPAFKVKEIMEDLANRAGVLPYHITLIALAAAGAGDEKIKSAVTYSCKSILPLNKTVVLSDAEAALEGAFGGEPGIIVIAGTGSIAWGKDAEGNSARAGGLGFILGDEGSGFWIGREALRNCLQSHHRGEKCDLIDKICQFWSLETISQAIALIYTSDRPAAKIAELAPLVFQSAAENEPLSKSIVVQTGREIGKLAFSVAARLNFPDKINFSVLGGISKQLDLLKPHIFEVLSVEKFNLSLPKYPAAVGGILLAKKSV